MYIVFLPPQMCNLFENTSSSEWLLYISEWESEGQTLSNIRVTTKVSHFLCLTYNSFLSCSLGFFSLDRRLCQKYSHINKLLQLLYVFSHTFTRTSVKLYFTTCCCIPLTCSPVTFVLRHASSAPQCPLSSPVFPYAPQCPLSSPVFPHAP